VLDLSRSPVISGLSAASVTVGYLMVGLPAGVLVGWNGEGHTSYMQGSSCVDNTVDAYLLSLRTPHSGTVCP